MSATARESESGTLAAPAVEQGLRGWRWRRRLLAAVLLVAAGMVVIVTDPFSGGDSGGGVSDNEYPTSTQMVMRESISQQTQVSATLGYAGDLTIRLPAGIAPAIVARAQQTLATARGVLTNAQSALQRDAATLAQVRATLAADQQ